MPSQKLENLLNLALQATTEEKEKSPGLATGYNPVARTWELIVKYHGQLTRLESAVIHVEPLFNSYAFVTLLDEFRDAFTQLYDLYYVEKPKRLYFS